MTFNATERTAIAARVRYELGYSSLTVAGEPYFAIAFAPEKALDSLYSGAETTSATAVTSTTVPTAITLASGTGFVGGLRIHVDVGSRREVAIAQSVTGAVLEALFSRPHSGTYPVQVESGESMLRTILARLDDIAEQLSGALATGGIKKVDEVEFFERQTRLTVLAEERNRWRTELASLLKLPNLNGQRRGARLEVY